MTSLGCFGVEWEWNGSELAVSMDEAMEIFRKEQSTIVRK
jgi:hypothetical protein